MGGARQVQGVEAQGHREDATRTDSCVAAASVSHIWASLNDILGDAPEAAAHAPPWAPDPESRTSSIPTPVPASSPGAAVHQLAPELVLAGGGGSVAGSWDDIEEMERESVQARQAAASAEPAPEPATKSGTRTC